MATDGPDPAPCAEDVYKNGVCVFVTDTIPSNAMERWVRKVAQESSQPVDWHFMGGRACVLTTGTVWRVVHAILKLKAEHDQLHKAARGEGGA